MNRVSIKIISLIMLLSLCVGFTSFSSDVDYDELANELNELKILNGNGVSYDLNSKLKRSEAATLIVKLMGKNLEVSKKTYSENTTGLTDIKANDWFYPYVKFCTENGIIDGFEDSTFRPNEYITEKAFTKLLLGVMGYEYGSDFTWSNIFRSSLELELNEDISYAFKEGDNVNFYRKDAFKLLHNSLDKKTKGNSKFVVENLIDNNIVPIEIVSSIGLLKNDELKSKITSLEVLSSKKIRVNFNEEISVDQEDIVISDGKIDFDILTISEVPTYIEITLVDNMTPSASYSISINSVKDIDNNVVKSLSYSFDGFKEDEIISDEFQISKVKAIDSKHIMLYFTHPVDEDSEQVLLYEMYNNSDLMFRGSYKNLTIDKLDQYNNAVLLTLKDNVLQQGNQYSIKIVGDLKSEYDTYLKNGDGDAIDFSLIESYDTFIEATSSYIYDKNLVKVEFNEILDYDDAKNLNNYYVTSDKSTHKVKPTKIYYDKDISSKDVYLRIPNMRTDAEYTLFVSGIHDIYGINKMNDFEQILGNGIASESSVNIEYIEAMNKNRIKIKFDNILNESSVKSTVISFNNKIIPKLKVISQEDKSEVIVYINKTKYLSEDTEYEVQVKSGLIDIFDRKQKYVLKGDFIGSDVKYDSAEVDEINMISENQLMVKFKTSLRKDTLSNIQNYKYEYELDGTTRYFFPTLVKVIDERSIILDFDYAYLNGEIKFIAENMYDISGQYKYSIIEKSFLTN